ncbi:hypothetical protein V1264_016779 [Littorina saxatilis]|uniref:HAT C-terminal dimerisation domain-containing protein n=1 Tax=Littorina saxatilis TaxID=31220 RepID=A0AAN9BGK4_9CAEN
MFLVDFIRVFEDINTELQSDKPKFYILKTRLERLLRDLLRFVKPSAMLYKHVLDVDFKSTLNIKKNTDLIIGDQARIFVSSPVESRLRTSRIAEFYATVVKCFQGSCEYIKKKLPLTDVLLKHAQVVDPAKQVDCSFESLDYFLKRFPKLVAPGVTTTDMQLEFSKHQDTDIRQCIAETDRVDATWCAVSKLQEDGQPMFQHLPMVMLSILTIPHSSAHCERIFSVVRKNKTDFRGSMAKDTLEALVVAKSRPGEALDRVYTNKELKDMKSAYYRSLQASSK